MPVILKNNVDSVLAQAINASETAMVVATGEGTKFPALAAGEYFYATLVSAQGTREIVKVTGKSGDTLAIQRGQEGTTANGFSTGSRVEMRVTAASITDLVDEHDQAAEISIADAGGYYTSDNVEGALQEAAQAATTQIADAGGYYTSDNVEGALQEAAQAATTQIADAGGYYTSDNVEGALQEAAQASTTKYVPPGAGAVTRTVQSRLRDFVSVKDFGAVGDGVTDDTAAINAALAAAAGSTVYVPAGTYVVTSTLSNNLSPVEGAFGPAIRMVGDGMLRTFFDNRVANGPMIDIDSANHGSSYEAVMGALLQGFMIKTTTSPANSDGIRILNGYEIVIDHLYIKGLTGNGIEMKNGLYVDDGWNMVKIKNCWIDTCAKWGIKADGSATRNEGSFTHLEQVFFQSNGTASASVPPPSGGMIWKGQILTMDQCGFANGNENVGLFIKGESGLGQTVTLRETTFENCYKKSLYVTGITQMAVDNCQVYNNDSFVATTGMEFDGSSYTIKNVDINGVVVRATAGNNPFTAFKISGTNAELKTCQVRNVVFDDFGYTGQVKQSGFKDTSTVIAHKDSAQNVVGSPSAIVFNQIDKDLQDCFDTATGQYTVSYAATFNVKGQITMTSLDADVEVAISLYDVSAAADIAKIIYNADGVTTQSFPFDFTVDLGTAGTTRSYEIRATQQSVGSKALDVSSNFYNTFTARRIPNGEVEF